MTEPSIKYPLIQDLSCALPLIDGILHNDVFLPDSSDPSILHRYQVIILTSKTGLINAFDGPVHLMAGFRRDSQDLHLELFILYRMVAVSPHDE